MSAGFTVLWPISGILWPISGILRLRVVCGHDSGSGQACTETDEYVDKLVRTVEAFRWESLQALRAKGWTIDTKKGIVRCPRHAKKK